MLRVGEIVTLKDIANRAGVSVSTVSRIINSPDDSFATKAVRDRVWEIVKETGYIPNQAARELKQKKKETRLTRTYTITCILGRTKTYEDNPFFAQVARAIEHQALSMGHAVATSYSILDLDHPELIQRINSVQTDGVIILGRFNSRTYDFFTKHYKNIGYVGRNVIPENLDQVICDGYEATKTAVQYLLDNGHRHIGYIGETVSEVRYQAFLDTLRENGLDCPVDLISRSTQDGTGGYLGARRLMETAKQLPTAVFCATDVSAIAAIRCFKEAGIKVPQQLSVISIDDIELAQYVSPMLTTVSMPKIEMGRIAVRTLIDRINKVHKLPMKILLPHKLIVRESTAKCLIQR